jgi:hypothetical protein
MDNIIVWAKAQVNKVITNPALKGGVIENQTISGLWLKNCSFYSELIFFFLHNIFHKNRTTIETNPQSIKLCGFRILQTIIYHLIPH